MVPSLFEPFKFYCRRREKDVEWQSSHSVKGNRGIYNRESSVLDCSRQPKNCHPTSHEKVYTVQILCIGTDGSQQTVQTKIRLLLKKQSDQGLRCLPFHQHLLDALIQCYIKLFYF